MSRFGSNPAWRALGVLDSTNGSLLGHNDSTSKRIQKKSFSRVFGFSCGEEVSSNSRASSASSVGPFAAAEDTYKKGDKDTALADKNNEDALKYKVVRLANSYALDALPGSINNDAEEANSCYIGDFDS